MEGVSVNVYKGLKKYWNRRRYVRLNNNNGSKIQTRVKLGQHQSDPALKRRRFWRFKVSPKIRIWMRFGSPKKWLTRLRDAYVNMMLKISNSGFIGGASGFGGSVQYGFGKCQVVKEYDEKMIVEFYKSFVIAQARLREVNENQSSVSFDVVGVDNDSSHKASKLSGSQNRISISTR